MKKRDHLLIAIELIFTLSFIAILGYMLNAPSGRVVSKETSLADYPKPFFSNNKYNFIFTTSDTISQDEYNCAISILSGMKEIDIVNPEQDLVPIGDGISNNHLKSSIRSKDLPVLHSGRVSLASDSISIHDEINLGIIGTSSIDTSSPSIESSLTKNKEYGSAIYLNLKPSSISYHYVLEDTADISQVNEDAPLTISFLGSELTITKVVSNSEFTALLGKENLLKIGSQIETQGKIVKVENIGLDAVIVNVDSQQSVIKNGASKTVSGIQIVVKDILFNDNNSIASLIIGSSVADSFKDGSTFGDCSTDCFVWDINNLLSKASGDIYKDGGPTIGIRNDFEMNGKNSIQGCISLPNEFAKLCFDSLNVKDYSNYHISKDSIDVSNAMPGLSSQDVIKISSGHSEGIEIKTSGFLQDKSGSRKTSAIYLRPNASDTVDVLYDDNGQVKWAGTFTASNSQVHFASVKFDRTSGDDIKIISSGQLSSLEIKFSPSGESITNDDIIIGMKSNLNGINKVKYGSDSKDISSYDLDQISRYGIIISDIKNSIEDDDIELKIPSNQVKARITLNGQSVSRQQSNVNIPSIIKGSEMTDFNQNIIAIGKDNQLYAKHNPGGWQYKDGQAIISLKKNDAFYTLLVAGSTSQDLNRACSILSNYYQNKNKLKGFIAVV